MAEAVNPFELVFSVRNVKDKIQPKNGISLLKIGKTHKVRMRANEDTDTVRIKGKSAASIRQAQLELLQLLYPPEPEYLPVSLVETSEDDSEIHGT
jgi:hypothetical protein